jgi:hypothetical protein
MDKNSSIGSKQTANLRISEMLYLGPSCEKWLNEIGIFTRGELEEFGIVNAYMITKSIFPTINMMFLYAMFASINGIDLFGLSPEIKLQLKTEVKEREQKCNFRK